MQTTRTNSDFFGAIPYGEVAPYEPASKYPEDEENIGVGARLGRDYD
jgi:hypothetical protein